MCLAAAIVSLTLMLPPSPQASSSPATLARMRDTYRPVLIFAPTGDPRLSQQIETLKSHRNDLIERQIKLVPFPHKYAGLVEGDIIAFLPAEEPSLRKRFHVKENDFTVILIGKDSGEKLRSRQPISFEKLRDTIDAMPMRKLDMQNHAKSQ